MSTYYEYREVKVMIAHRLMAMEGWKVYGYSPDQSDSMTDYYCPAHWGGVAEKNGYILCVNVYGAKEKEEIRKYNYSNFSFNKDIQDKIVKLEAMTVERGASEQEEQSAKMMIERLQKKAETETENNQKYNVIGFIPAHQAHPPKCNWHIEKDGVIVAKGNGILKYASIDNYYNYTRYMEDMSDYKTLTKEEYKTKYIHELMHGSYYRYYSDETQAEQAALEHMESIEKDLKLMNQFEEFINKLDTTCGCLVGEGEIKQYETIKVTEYKKENKAVEATEGSIKDGQCFIVKTSFNYGHNKGYVYRIHETEYNGRKSYQAIKLNGKLTKECTGTANQSNYWYITENFIRWFEKGSLAWCEIQEVKTPYEVEKVVKKVIKSDKATTKTTKQSNNKQQEQSETTELNGLHYEIKEDIDTRDNSKIYVVKVVEKLDRDEYLTVNNNMKSLGGYYSRFKHGFIFKEDPTELLNNDIKLKEIKETEQPQQEEPEAKKSIDYEIEQSQHTKTKEDIWLVKIKNNLSKDDFAEVKRNLATLKGFYSSFNNSFIFKYDPTEKLKSTA